MDHHHDYVDKEHEGHSTSLVHELMHHLPYAIFSVALSLIVLSLITHVTSIWHGYCQETQEKADALFHNFHFLHIIFAATGTVITFLRFSKSL